MDAHHPEHFERGGSCAGPAGAAEKAGELELFDPVEIVLVLILILITENIGEILGIHLDVRADFIKGMITLSLKF